MRERAVPPPDIAPHDFFTRWVPRSVETDAHRRDHLVGTEAILHFELLEGPEGEIQHFTLEIAQGRVEGRPGAAAEPDLRVRLDVATWRQLNSGELSAPEAFLRRRVQLRGNLALAVKLHFIIG